jgi:hypothetical protein
VDHGVEVVIMESHGNRSAPSGWMMRLVRFLFGFGRLVAEIASRFRRLFRMWDNLSKGTSCHLQQMET